MKNRLSILGTLALCSVSLTASDKTPNIVLILADDMRASSMQFIGKEAVKTPNLDQLASQSVVFTQAHIMGGTSGAVSMPSRAMLMTGKYLHNLKDQGATIPDTHTLIGETLQQAGYNTFHTGKWHSSYEALNRCFNDGRAIFFGGMADHWNVPLYDYSRDGKYGKKRPVIETPSRTNEVKYLTGEYMYSGKHSVDIFSDEAVRFIDGQQETGKPFFLSVAYMSPHDPRSMPEKYLALYPPDSIILPPNYREAHPFDNGELAIRDEVLAALPRQSDEIKKHIREYYAMITHLDDRVGDIIRALKEAGVYENTILVFAGDNGLAVGQHGLMGKQNVYEHSLGVPLIIKEAGRHTGRKTDKLCYLIDVYPTLCEMAGFAVPQSADGRTLTPVIRNDQPVRDYLYFGYLDKQRALSDGEWKLIEYNVNGKRTTQLFNLKDDPWETTNLSAQKKYQKIIKKLRGQMVTESHETNDTAGFL